ncbi:MAG: OmpA family protein [Bacteroidetes bacterium]|nr:OmpA family protein [Bacteroidota bacterium]
MVRLLFLSTVLVWFVMQGCLSPPGKVDTGDQAFAKKKYFVAVQLYEEEILHVKSESGKAVLAFKIAESYRSMNMIDEAAKWYKEAVKKNFGSEANFKYAQILKSQEKYTKAIEAFNTYKDLQPGNTDKADREIEGCKDAMDWKRMKTNFLLEPLDAVNTKYADYSPVIYGEDVVFASDRSQATGSDIYDWTGEEFSDIFITKTDASGELSKPELFENNNLINTDAHEGGVCFNHDLTEMYFTRCGSEGKTDDYCDIYVSRLSADDSWSEPELLPFFGDSINNGHPSLSIDGSQLFFSSDVAGGFGGKDLYVSDRTADGWSYPVNMGSKINTAGDEMFPFIYIDGSIYFSSNGHIGMGGLDLYHAERKNKGWVVSNMQYPMNSGADDFGMVFEEKDILGEFGYFESTGYFSSTRDGGKGNDDIYKFTVEKPAFFLLEVNILEKVFQKPDDPNSKVIDYKPLEAANIRLTIGDSLMHSVFTDETGMMRFRLQPKSEYQVVSSKEDYLTKSEGVYTTKFKYMKNMAITISLEIIMDKKYDSIPIVIRNVYYDFDSYYIRADAAKELDTLALMLLDNPNIQVEIGSHTDSRGSFSYNEKLSQKRAEACVKYLVSKGVARTRLVAKGYGEVDLKVKRCTDGADCTEKEHQRNRRTTFRIINDNFELESIEPDDIIVDFAPNFGPDDKDDDSENEINNNRQSPDK